MAVKVTRGGELLKSFCAGTCTTAKACLLADQHRKIVECDLHSEVVSTAVTNLHLLLALQVLNTNSDSTGHEKVRAAARAFKKRVTVVFARRKATA